MVIDCVDMFVCGQQFFEIEISSDAQTAAYHMGMNDCTQGRFTNTFSYYFFALEVSDGREPVQVG